MKKSVILVLALFLVSIIGCPFTLAVDTYAPVAATGVTTIQAESFAGANYSASAQGTAPRVVPCNNTNWLSFKVNIAQAGVYTVKTTTAVPTSGNFGVTINTEGVETIISNVLTVGGSWTVYNTDTIGSMNLPAGNLTLKLAYAGTGCMIDLFTLEKTGEPGSVVDTLNIRANRYSAFYSPNATETTNGKLGEYGALTDRYIAFNNARWTEYNVNIPVDGAYSIAMYYGATVVNPIMVYQDGVELCSAQVPATGGWETYQTFTLGAVNLTKGLNKIKLLNTGGGMYFKYFTLQRSGDISFKTEYTTAVEKLTGSLDYSSGTTLSVSTVSQGKYVSFGLNDWLTYSVGIEYGGTYRMIVNGALPSTWTTAYTGVAVLADGMAACSGEVLKTNDFYDWSPSTIGLVNLTRGTHTIKFISTGANFHFNSFRLERIGKIATPSYTVQAEAYNLDGEGIGYHDTTPGLDSEDNIFRGDGVEVIATTADLAVQVSPGEWMKYDVTMEKSGYYHLKFVMAGDGVNKNITVTANNKTQSFAIKGIIAGTYSLVDACDIVLNAGVNTIKIEFTSTSGTFDFDSIKIYKPNVVLYKNTAIQGNEITAVESGTIIAQADYNGLFNKETVNCIFAVYKNNQLYKVSYGNQLVTESDLLLNSIDSLEIINGNTYTAKVFLWNEDMIGDCFAY